jgi:cytoskeleton protein RodZ
MTDPVATTPDSPGAMLRAARERQGLHIAALAAAIKVAPRKLDALENDRWQELPDATFARALAQTVCRTLKVDPQPILNRLPRPDAGALEHVGGTLNMPFQDGGPREESWLGRLSLGPMVLASAVLMLAALVLYFVPLPWGADDRLNTPQPVVLAPEVAPAPAAAATGDDTAGAAEAEAPAEAAAAPPAPAAAGGVAAEATGGVASAPPAAAASPGLPTAPTPSPAAPAATAASPPLAVPPSAPGLLRLRASDESWVEVRDADERLLFSRVLQPGETVDLNGAPPLRLVVGNAGATEVLLRGQPLNLAPLARNNVVRTTLR